MAATKILVFNDLHIPFQDDKCVEFVLSFAKRTKPQRAVILGDMIDCYSISRFDKDPARHNDLQADLDRAVEFLQSLRSILPASQIWYMEGNHELRFQKYLWKKAPELSCLRSLSLTGLLGLKDLGIKYFKDTKQLGDLYFCHGDIIRKHAGYSAKAMYDRHGVTMIHGHSHRDGKYTHRTHEGHFAVWENYCLCTLDPEYIELPDWTQGFSLVTMIGKRPYVEQIPIINGSYIYGGKLYK